MKSYNFIYTRRDVDNQRCMSTFAGNNVYEAEDALYKAFPDALDPRICNAYDSRSLREQDVIDYKERNCNKVECIIITTN